MTINKNEVIPAIKNSPDPHRWVDDHANYLYNYAMARIRDEEHARDLVQETFLAALGKLENFKGLSSERTWLTGILKHKIIDTYRKKSSGLFPDPQIHDPEDFFRAEDGHWQAVHQPQAFGIEQYDPFVNKEFHDVLQKCMRKLPDLWLSVFTMKHLDGQDTRTICTGLNLTASNFWVIIHRAKVHLRACLQKNWV